MTIDNKTPGGGDGIKNRKKMQLSDYWGESPTLGRLATARNESRLTLNKIKLHSEQSDRILIHRLKQPGSSCAQGGGGC